jgi:NAD-dependent deacetylase
VSIVDYFKKKPDNSRKIYIYSGAGISVESGIKTFRGQDGLWENHEINEVCNFRTWEKNYDLVHEFYNQRRYELRNCRPNKAHKIIASLQKKYGVDNIINVTTNIDNLFEKASVKNTVHLHGKLNEIYDLTKQKVLNVGENSFSLYKTSDHMYKPGVVFFNEPTPEYIHMKSNAYNMKDGDIVITIGMSFNVVPANYVMPYSAKVIAININPDTSTNHHYKFDHCFNESASDGLEAVLKLLDL